jgi:hypothetical protein
MNYLGFVTFTRHVWGARNYHQGGVEKWKNCPRSMPLPSCRATHRRAEAATSVTNRAKKALAHCRGSLTKMFLRAVLGSRRKDVCIRRYLMKAFSTIHSPK